eukprot:gene3162-5478_t
MDLSSKARDFKDKVDKIIEKVLQFDKDEDEIDEKELDATLLLLFKIFNNILEFPGDARRKKLKGKKIDQLLEQPGAWSCLQLGGFQKFGNTLELRNEKFSVSHIQILVDVLYLQLNDEDKKKVVKIDFKEKESKTTGENLTEESLKVLQELQKQQQQIDEKEEKEKLEKREAMKKKLAEAKKKVEEMKLEEKPQDDSKPYQFQYIQVNQKVDENAPKLFTSREKKLLSDFVKELAAILYDNEDDDKVIQTLKMLKSIIKNSTNLNEKYRTINPSNQKINEFIIKMEGGTDILKFLEFEYNSTENIYMIEKGKMSEKSAEILCEKLNSLIENQKWKNDKKGIAAKRREKKTLEEERKKAQEKRLEQQRIEQAQEIYDHAFLEEFNKFVYPVLMNGSFTEQIIDFLIRVLQNTLKEEDKYRHLKLTNEKIISVVVTPKGVLDFLKFLGFKEESNEMTIEKDLLTAHQIDIIVKEFLSIKSSKKWLNFDIATTSVESKPKTETKKVEKIEKKVEPVNVNSTSQKRKEENRSPSDSFPNSKQQKQTKEQGGKKSFFSGLFSWASPEHDVDEFDVSKK